MNALGPPAQELLLSEQCVSPQKHFNLNVAPNFNVSVTPIDL